ncbi:cytochrome P450 [Oceanibacterium hippocampi]|uniref:Pentalenene oxygenase n=1 Tax=Oceanibacterium hippocampi TaxID=745714 RepID=A0A1Y5T736_9PROT|nr:cytochrome P450 [Oceanibacterium hippocampi]SLN57414.1 Pentalenene oxygenase [Oceanibacterium hippocampi]
MSTSAGKLGLFEIYRRLNRDPESLFRSIDPRAGLGIRRFLFRKTMVIWKPEHLHHVLVGNARNYDKSPLARALFRPIIGNGLLVSEGSFWRRQRRIAAPAFHHRRIREFARTMQEETDAQVDGWCDAVARGESIDMLREMSKLTVEIICRTMFSQGLDAADKAAVGQAMNALNERGTVVRVRDLIGVPEWFPRIESAATRRAMAVLDRIIEPIIRSRRADPTDRGDLLSMFMLARDEETGEGMSDRQLRDEVMTMFLAGHETTATTLAWAAHALTTWPGVQERLCAEVDAVVGDRAVAFEDLPKLPYARQIIEETMRFHPTVPQIARDALDDDVIDGVPVPKGTIMTVQIWLAHRNPEVWEEPERFDPDRFSPEGSADRPRLAYLPFGAGPRICIGNSFAMMEAQIILATIARRFRFVETIAPQVRGFGTIVLRPKGGMAVRLEAR